MQARPQGSTAPSGRLPAQLLPLSLSTRRQFGKPVPDQTQPGRPQVEGYASERELLDAFVVAVRALDPDVLLGWEVQQGSLGYLADRAQLLELPLLKAISRAPEAGGPPPPQPARDGPLQPQ